MNIRILGALALLSVTVPAMADIAKPDAKITSFRLEKISLKDVTFAFELTVTNPYPVGLPISGMTLDFAVEGTKVFQAANQGKFNVPASGKKATKFTVALSYEGVAAAVKNYLEKDWLDTDITGKLTIALPKLPGLPKDISFDYALSQKIPALKPEISLASFSVKGPSEADIADAIKKGAKKIDAKAAAASFAAILSGKKPDKAAIKPQDLDVPFTITYTLVIDNKSKAKLGFTSLGYGLTINGQSLVSGTSTDVKNEGSRTLVTVENTFRSKSLSDSVQKVFQDRKGAFQVKGTAQIQVPPSVRKEPVPLDFDESGSFSF